MTFKQANTGEKVKIKKYHQPEAAKPGYWSTTRCGVGLRDACLLVAEGGSLERPGLVCRDRVTKRYLVYTGNYLYGEDDGEGVPEVEDLKMIPIPMSWSECLGHRAGRIEEPQENLLDDLAGTIHQEDTESIVAGAGDEDFAAGAGIPAAAQPDTVPPPIAPPVNQEIDLTILDDDTPKSDQPVSVDPSTILNNFKTKNTTLIFTNSNNNPIRYLPLSKCMTVSKLFAYTAATFQIPSAHELVLLVQLNEQTPITIVKGDEEDFIAFVQAISKDACWVVKQEGGDENENKRKCRVKIRVL